MITVWIDQLSPCLIDATTGEIVETEVVRVVRRSFLAKYNRQTGWYVDWVTLADKYEIYALVLKGTVNIQGLLAIQNKPSVPATYVAWMCANPASNPQETEHRQFLGIGGHLFAIAVDKAYEFGCGGEFYGFAANQELMTHYQEKFGAIHVGVMHPYHFVIDHDAADAIKGEYTYEWTSATL